MSKSTPPGLKKITTHTFRIKKESGEKLTLLTAYDFLTASAVDQAEIDSIVIQDLQIDQTTHRPEVRVEIALNRGQSSVFPFTPIDQEFEFDRDRLLIYKTIPFQGLEEGEYTLQFRITDEVGSQSVEQAVQFVMQ